MRSRDRCPHNLSTCSVCACARRSASPHTPYNGFFDAGARRCSTPHNLYTGSFDDCARSASEAWVVAAAVAGLAGGVQHRQSLTRPFPPMPPAVVSSPQRRPHCLPHFLPHQAPRARGACQWQCHGPPALPFSSEHSPPRLATQERQADAQQPRLLPRCCPRAAHHGQQPLLLLADCDQARLHGPLTSHRRVSEPVPLYLPSLVHQALDPGRQPALPRLLPAFSSQVHENLIAQSLWASEGRWDRPPCGRMAGRASGSFPHHWQD